MITKNNLVSIRGAGDWVIVDGLFYDPKRKAFIKRCSECHVTFYAKRRTARVCSPACRQHKSRRLRRVSARGII